MGFFLDRLRNEGEGSRMRPRVEPERLSGWPGRSWFQRAVAPCSVSSLLDMKEQQVQQVAFREKGESH